MLLVVCTNCSIAAGGVGVCSIRPPFASFVHAFYYYCTAADCAVSTSVHANMNGSVLGLVATIACCQLISWSISATANPCLCQ